ncbi:MAG: phosphoadenylyl-sulfate reductase [Neisseria sp.]|nr:phosphoadenylyl-sulfate reductase [Neisseria sp.]
MPEPHPATVAALPEKIRILDKRLQEIAERFPQAVSASSLAAEDMIITARIAVLALPLRVITLDTGRLHPETAALITAVRRRYPDLAFAVFTPDTEAAAAFDGTYGAGAVYESVAKRQACCRIRKIEPLNRALNGAPAWLTGQRRSQSVTRTDLCFEEWDEARQCAKFNPIFDWEDDDVWAFVQTADVPLNALYAQGYPSIGCEPCTLPVKAGEDIRAGRWWWEQKDSKECGLHQ